MGKQKMKISDDTDVEVVVGVPALPELGSPARITVVGFDFEPLTGKVIFVDFAGRTMD